MTVAADAARHPSEFFEPVRKAIQVHDSYLIAETGDGMVVIDQHALHERILYEELRSRVARGSVESQRLLVPEPVDLPAAEAAILIEQSELLAQLGLEIESFGGDTVLVRSAPAMLRQVNPERLVRDLAEHLRTQPLPPTRDGMLARAHAHDGLQGGREGGPAAFRAGDRGTHRTREPGGQLASLSARAADCAGLYQSRPGETVRSDVTGGWR